MKIIIFIPFILQIAIILSQTLDNQDNVELEVKLKEQQLQQKLELEHRKQEKELSQKENAQIETLKINEKTLAEQIARAEQETNEDGHIPSKLEPLDDETEPIGPVGEVEYADRDDFLCDYLDPNVCRRNRNCIWETTQNCANKQNCQKVPLVKCGDQKLCHLTPSTAGYCSGPPLHCKPYSFIQCKKDPLCLWQSTYKCLPKDPQPVIPDCGGMNVQQCVKNSQFCNLYGKCFDNKNYCSSLNYFQCIHDPACNYTFTQKEQCLDNPNFCQNLNETQCMKNTQFCNGVYTIPQCVNQFNCDGLNQDQCKQNFKYCQNVSIPFTCKPRKNICSTFTDILTCKLNGCNGTFIDGQFVCVYATPCSQFNEQQCITYQNQCIYTPGSFTCKNNFDCDTIDDPNHCKLTKGCYLIPSQFKCLPKKQKCKLLSGTDCKNNPACTYIPAKGNCSQDMDFGCENLSLLQCQNNKHCSSKYSCTPKPIPKCNSLDQIECKKSVFCQLVEKGQCYDKKYDCNLAQNQCILQKPCQWHPGINGICANNLECSGLSTEECKENNNYCNFNSTGNCRPR